MKKHIKSLLLATVLVGTSCSSHQETSPANAEPETIGTALLKPDGTIVLTLASEGVGNSIAHAQLSYKKDDPQYSEVLKHVGPLKVGVHKNVLSTP